MTKVLPSLKIAGVALYWSAMAHAAPAVDGTTFFETKIRPLFIENCQKCHGDKKQENGLRLDSKAGWQNGGDHGAAIKPGDPENSLMIKAVRRIDKNLQMPPKHPLKDEEIAALEEWVKMGAPDPRQGTSAAKKGIDMTEGRKHWAFQPIGHPQPPTLAINTWSHSAVDCFILEKLQRAGLQPSPAADRLTLIRRATFDLTGLSPTPAEVEAFVSDLAPDAYARLIERLLASPHYGEHWARHWLDVARYSDTKGYVYAREEKMWIHATSYRDWVVKALNDDMPYDRFVQLQVAADQIEPAGSPHLAAMGFLTLGRRFLGVTHDIIDDRIDVVTRGLLGLTTACARCHDHKYDPIPTRDYYALYGVFQSSAEKVVPCGLAKGTVYEKEWNVREQKLRETMATRREEQSARVRATVKEHLIAQLELEKYPEEAFGQLLDLNDINPVFVRRWKSYLSEDEKSTDPIFAEWHALKSKGVIKDLHEAAARYGTLFADIEKQWRALLKSQPDAKALPNTADERLRGVLYTLDSPCYVPDEHIANTEMFFTASTVVEIWKLQGEVDRWLMQNADAPPQATILVDRSKPSTPRIFTRGNPLTKGAEVPRQFLQVLSEENAQPFVNGSGRLELAQAIANPSNPLTARVMVNRVWQHHFGHGLVSTPSDFGKRAEIPSHPELLDWLAQHFTLSGWSIKEMHRLIMLSQTYQQRSGSPSDAIELTKVHQLDPENRLLWRMNPHRLSFEEARDAWLAASGELNLIMGGRPESLFAKQNTRRTLYTLVDRENLPTVLRTFDFANPDLSIPQRNETTVPQQALFSLNHPFIASRASAITQRLKGSDAASKISHLYSLLYQRTPTEHEMESALNFVQLDSAPLAQTKQPNAWQYGYGEWDEATGRIKSFTSLPHFNGSAWQGGDNWPDEKLGWVQITATGGHPGNDRQHAVVRRWIAPQDGNYTLTSSLIHEPEPGDGIRAFVSHNKRGLLRSTSLHQSTEQINLETIAMNKSDTLDFIVDIRDGLNSDQFLWSPMIKLSGGAGSGGDIADQAWFANKDFDADTITLLPPWEQLAQVLMLSNEFMFVD